MPTIMTRPPVAVTTPADELEPRRESTPAPLPRRPVPAGLVDDMESEDDRRGPEPEPDPTLQLHALVRHYVHTGDRRAARAGRRAPRTFAEMQARPAEYDARTGSGTR